MRGGLVGKAFFEVAIGNCDADLKKQVCVLFQYSASFFDHPSCDKVVDARFG